MNEFKKIDENTPTDRNLLLYHPPIDQHLQELIAVGRQPVHYARKPTYYAELPEVTEEMRRSR